MSAGGGSPEAPAPEPSAAEKIAADDRRRTENEWSANQMRARYAVGAAAYPEPKQIESDIRRGIELGMFGRVDEGGPEDPNWSGPRVEADPAYAADLDQMRAAWNAAMDSPAAVGFRETRMWDPTVWRGGPPRPVDMRNALTRLDMETLEEATERRASLLQTREAKLVGNRPDGLFGFEGRLEGTSPQTIAEIARDRELFRLAEEENLREDYKSAIGAFPAGPSGANARVERMVEFFEEGMARGIFDLSQYQEQVAPTGGKGGPRMENRFGVKAAEHDQNRELAPALTDVFREVLNGPELTDADRLAFSAALGRLGKERIDQLRQEGTDVQERGLEAARRAAESREIIRRLGSSPEERRAQEYEARLDELAERRQRHFIQNPGFIRPGERPRPGQPARLDLDHAYDEAMAQHSEFAASVRASGQAPQELIDRVTDVQNRLAAANRAGDFRLAEVLREELEGSAAETESGKKFGGLRKEMMDRYDAGAQEQRRRNREIAKNPGRFETLASGADQVARRQWFLNEVMVNGLLNTYNPQQDRFEGGQWAPGGILGSSYQREKVTPFLKLALDAQYAGNAAEEWEWTRKAASAWEESLATYTRGIEEAERGSREISSEVAKAVAAGQEGVFFLGRSVDPQFDVTMLETLQDEFGMVLPTGEIWQPSSIHRHNDTNGHERARDVIYRAPSFNNVAVVARYNEDGKLVSTEVHVTNGTALRQRRDGTFTRNASPGLVASLDRTYAEQEGAVSNPIAADRAAGSDFSVGTQWANAGTDGGSDVEGYRPPIGSLLPQNLIRDGLFEAGLPFEAARVASQRRAQRAGRGQRSLWWFEWRLSNRGNRLRGRTAA
jgi:hypothetical protein